MRKMHKRGGHSLLILVLIIISTAAIPQEAKSRSPMATLGDLLESVELQLRITSNEHILPDSSRIDFAARAVSYVSTDIGGVEQRVKIDLSDNQAFYALPDSVVEIVAGYFIKDYITKPLKELPPYWDDNYISPNEGDPPQAYSLFDDSIKIFPIPTDLNDGDSAYFDLFVEHDVLTDSTDNIRFSRNGYNEAAVVLTIVYCYESLRMWDAAAFYQAKYDKMKTELRQRYAQKVQIWPVSGQ